MKGRRLWLGLLAAAALAPRLADAQAFQIVVNECATGSSGWVELLNRGSTALELAKDPHACWQVDDQEGGGAPKTITDLNVSHAPSSTTCSSRNRPATCGVVGAGERVWIKYAYLNGVSADQCRLLSAPRAGSTCAAPAADPAVGGPTSSSSAGQCFGRQPDGGAWVTGGMSCSQGQPNGSCSPGAACDDANSCTANTVFSSSCQCGGGTKLSGNVCGPGKICASGACIAGTSAPHITPGSSDLLLSGTIVTPDTVLEGELLIVGDTITCVAASCQDQPAAAAATRVQTSGVIFPGLIDTHNHIQFDIFDESDWAPESTDNFTNHNQWPERKRYKALVDTKQYLNGEAGSPVSIGCELLKYGELKGLIAGTTSIVGGAIPTNKQCYGSLARTIDQLPNGLGYDKVQAATLFPAKATDADGVCQNLASGKTTSYVIHIAEGVDETSRKEFQKLFDVTTTDGCLFSPQTSIVHGTSLTEPHLGQMAERGMGLVWSPQSNVFLYGHGTDLSQTANIPAALDKGITVALAPDWSIGGSQNLLDELRFAERVDNQQWGDAITPKLLAAMATKNPAKLLGLGSVLGRLAPGLKADIAVIAGDRSRPYDALLAATPKAVRLVLVGGKVLYGDDSLKALAPATPACEALDVCGAAKFVCVAAPGGTAADKLGQSYADIKSSIETELKKYDDKNLTEWDFSPIAPLYKCP
jgi:5-methylthioadenosine/S-adenosylhomocysteine deaminase